MLIHRIQTLTHWLAHRSSYKNFMSALSKIGGGYTEIKQGQEDYSGKKYARQVYGRQVLNYRLIDHFRKLVTYRKLGI